MVLVHNNLKPIRQSKGILQITLAREALIGVSTLQEIEYGKSKPNVYTAQRLAKILNCGVQDIFPLDTSEEKTDNLLTQVTIDEVMSLLISSEEPA
jgi:DNA-binding XRE family transcriptional regulator